jgi:hypothetical protein
MLIQNIQKNSELSRYTLDDQLKLLLNTFSEEILKLGIRVFPYSETGWERYASLPKKTRQSIYSNFSSYYDLMSSSQHSGIELHESKRLVWNILKLLGMRPCHDLLDKIDEQDVIEIYSSDFLQVFRNLKFMEICSYSMLDTLTHSWSELFMRPSTVTDSLIKRVQFTLSGDVKNTLTADVEEHFLHEIFSTSRNFFRINQKYISPVFFPDGKPAGVVGTLSAELLGSHLQTEVEIKDMPHG